MKIDLNKIFGFAAFIFFALSLCVPTGYSYGALCFVVAAILGLRKLKLNNISFPTGLLAAIFLLMGITWSHTFNGIFNFTGSDQWLKYGLAALCLLVVAEIGLKPVAVQWGIAAGGAGALAIASYQYLALGLNKATGYTNAIQYGGLAMYMGLAAWTLALLSNFSRSVKFVLWGTGACGVMGSLLSETRGAWVVAPLLIAVVLGWLWQYSHSKIVVRTFIVVVAMFAAMVLPYGEKFLTRGQMAVAEFQQYTENPVKAANTSIGQRLEQWRLAWAMWKEQPFLGWGTEGSVLRKQAYVDQGLAHPSVMNYGHAHNEILDMLAKRGALGLTMLLMFYAIPLAVFWPTRSRITALPETLQRQALALRAAASLLPIAYFGFGWTQVFFAHNSGHMFYMFGIVSFWGAIQQLERSSQQRT